jgi:hypothetical protein
VCAETEVRRTLDDGKKYLVGSGVGMFAPLGPADGSFDSLFQLWLVARKRCTLVEAGNYVGTEPILNFGYSFSIKVYFCSIDVACKLDTVIIDFN